MRANKKIKPYQWTAVLLSGFTSSFITSFLRGKLIAIPDGFPYSHGVWNVIGVGVILFITFAIIIAVALVTKGQSK